MARLLPLPIATVRHLLLALLALGLVFRPGAACDAMAMFAPSVARAACADMPVEHGKRIKAASVDCAPCVGLPARVAGLPASAAFGVADPTSGVADRLTGLSGGPAPPPPRIV